MEARDLRIGNWVWNDVQKVPTQVCIGLLNEQHYADKGIGYSWSPIPLTEEMLLNCGFDKVREYFTIDNEFDVFKDNKGYYTHINCGNIYLNSLHQLQNLFYALTQQELLWQQK